MTFRDFSECVGQEISWDLGGRHGTLTGSLDVEGGEYKLKTKSGNYNLGAVSPVPPSRIGKAINEQNKIIIVGEVQTA